MLFVVLGVLVAVANGFGLIKNVDPFLSYFLAIGTTFILGSSGADALRIYRCASLQETPTEEKTP